MKRERRLYEKNGERYVEAIGWKKVPDHTHVYPLRENRWEESSLILTIKTSELTLIGGADDLDKIGKGRKL